MKSTISFHICTQTISLFIILVTIKEVFIGIFCKVVSIYKILACVVRRVDVYYLYLVEISLLEALQYIEVISLNIKVLGVVEVHALLTTRAECGIDRGVGEQDSFALVWPCKLVTLRLFRHHAIGKVLLQFLKIN